MTPGSASPFFKSVGRHFTSCRYLYVPGFSIRGFAESRAVAQRVYETHLTSSRSGAIKWVPAWLKKLQISFQYNSLRRYFESKPGMLALCWNGLDRKRLMFSLAAQHANVPVLYSELAPFAGYLQLDPQGINAACSLPKDLDFYRKWDRTTPEVPDWGQPLKSIVARAPRNPQSVTQETSSLPLGPYLFVPLQVEGDSQLRYFGGWINNIQSLLEAIDKAAVCLPEGWHVRIKEHPSSTRSFAEAILKLPSGRCYLSNGEDTFAQVQGSSGVVTVNSSVGLQSFAYQKPVCVLGQAFYGFEPIVNVAPNQDRLNRIFARPHELFFDEQGRTVFLRYLLQQAYVKFNLKHKENNPESALEKTLERLTQSPTVPK